MIRHAAAAALMLRYADLLPLFDGAMPIRRLHGRCFEEKSPTLYAAHAYAAVALLYDYYACRYWRACDCCASAYVGLMNDGEYRRRRSR